MDASRKDGSKYCPPALALLRSQLEGDELAAAWVEGAAMPEDEAYNTPWKKRIRPTRLRKT